MKNVTSLLKLGITPVLYGDAVLDSVLKFTILSGDQLASFFAMKLNAERIIIGLDVDGLYTADPKIDSSAHLIHELSLFEFKRIISNIGGSITNDVTGGMLGKMLELKLAVERGIQAIIVNALKPGNVRKALVGEKVIGTTFKAGDTII
jgi:isopentenyl phosphate kinase